MDESSTPMTEPYSNLDDWQKPGFLDEVLEVFDRHKHPFIMVEECAMTWMGAAVVVGQDCDVLVRSEPLPEIVGDLIMTGRWRQVEHSHRTQELMIYSDVPRIQRVPTVFELDIELCLSFWTEEKYHLTVSGPTVEALDCCALNIVLVEDRFNPRQPHGPRSLSTEGICFVPEMRARSFHCSIPILIPTIPRFLDAELDRYRDNVDKSLVNKNFVLSKPFHTLRLIRSLFLDVPRQKMLMLSEMAQRNRPMMEHLIETVLAKPSSLQSSLTPQQQAAWEELRARRLI